MEIVVHPTEYREKDLIDILKDRGELQDFLMTHPEGAPLPRVRVDSICSAGDGLLEIGYELLMPRVYPRGLPPFLRPVYDKL